MFQKNPIDAKLDEEILRLLISMEVEMDKQSDEYVKTVDQFNKLYELRHKSRISMETLATIGANLLGLVVIMNHERANVIASKAFALVKKII